MTNRKKVNTLDLIQQMTQKNKETLNEVEHIKQERSPKTGITEGIQHFGPKSVRKESIKIMPEQLKPKRSDNGTELDKVGIKLLDILLDTVNFNDKKETFTWSMSGDCLARYEYLATAVSYKIGRRTSRNQLMRRVLEDFIHRKYGTLIKEIELK